MSPIQQSCNASLLVHQAASKVQHHLQSPSVSAAHQHHAAVAAAALSSPFSSLLGAAGSSYLLGDHLKPTATNHLF